MNENGFDVVMVSSDGPELETVRKNEGCRHYIIPMTRRMTPLTDLRCLWLMYRFLKKEKPDIVHSHTPKAGLITMLAARMAGIRIRIHTIAGLRFMTSRGMGRKVLVAMEKLTARAATHVWPNSYSLLQYIQENKLVQPGKLEVIGTGSSNGIDLKRYSRTALQSQQKEEVRKLIHYDPTLIYFVSVGRLVHDKGIDELVHAFLKVYEQNDRVRLVLVGAFEDEVDPVSEDTKAILKTHPGIILPGWSNAVEYFMELSFALVHPSHREGFPNVLLQAGGMLCPIICSRIEGNVDIVTHRQTGLLFEVQQQQELQQQLEFALANPDLMQDYARALRLKIEQQYSQPVIHGLLRDKYMALLGKN
jgi:glycosyltransferase involved in cell wall biosynthesis